MLKKRSIRGVSPVVATVLLVAITIIIGLIVFLWFRGLKGETCFKFDQNIELVCRDAEFFADYNIDSGELYISNTGNIPIFGMKAKIEDISGHTTLDLSSKGWPGIGLNQGNSISVNIGTEVVDAESITLIPVLMGSCGNDGDKTYMCNEKDYGYKILLE